MSYDLFFTSYAISRVDFNSYFSRHSKLSIEQKSGKPSMSKHEVTGVYFSFDHSNDDG